MSQAPATGRRRPADAGVDPDELAALEEQRDFLLRSLEDLDREHAAGDLDDGDHAALRDDYTARAAEVIRAIEQRRTTLAEARRPASTGRRLAVVAGVVAFAVLAGWLVAASLGGRGAGDTASGGIDVQRSPSQRAQQTCIPLMSSAPGEAIECFRGVLDDDPRNVVAMSWLAWTVQLSSGGLPPEQSAELQESAQNLVDRAVELDPGYSYARAFRAIIAFQRGRFEDADRYLAEFEENDPSADAVAVIEQMDLENRIDAALAGITPDGATTTTAPPG